MQDRFMRTVNFYLNICKHSQAAAIPPTLCHSRKATNLA